MNENEELGMFVFFPTNVVGKADSPHARNDVLQGKVLTRDGKEKHFGSRYYPLPESIRWFTRH
jgi:hypothetical protein